MSGFYNLVFGICPYAPELLLSLGVTDVTKIERLRDAFFNKDGSEAIIYTRMGGNNRKDYAESIEYLRALPGFLGDEDDPYDATYAIFRYKVPELMAEYVPMILERGIVRDPWTMWAEVIEKMRKEGLT